MEKHTSVDVCVRWHFFRNALALCERHNGFVHVAARRWLQTLRLASLQVTLGGNLFFRDLFFFIRKRRSDGHGAVTGHGNVYH